MVAKVLQSIEVAEAWSGFALQVENNSYVAILPYNEKTTWLLSGGVFAAAVACVMMVINKLKRQNHGSADCIFSLLLLASYAVISGECSDDANKRKNKAIHALYNHQRKDTAHVVTLIVA